jgi:hypothetical protein
MQSGDTCTRDRWRKISLHSFRDPKKLQNTEIRIKITDIGIRRNRAKSRHLHERRVEENQFTFFS